MEIELQVCMRIEHLFRNCLIVFAGRQVKLQIEAIGNTGRAHRRHRWKCQQKFFATNKDN